LMNHPGIARVLDAGSTEDGRPYFVMEHVEDGVPLNRYCDERRLGIGVRLDLFVRVCAAVAHAHQKGIIHRDLKPSNVLVTTLDGRPIPKVIDFGIAKALEPDLKARAHVTEAGAIVGTLEYMSPEQAELDAIDIDTRADIYSLGAILYELLVGVLPIDPEVLRKGGLIEILTRIRELEPVRPSARLEAMGPAAVEVAETRSSDVPSLRKVLREDLDWIALKALEKDRGRRYSGALEFAEDIRRHFRQEPVSARPPTVRYRTRKLARRYRWQLAVAVAAVLLAVTWGLVSWRLQVRDARQLLRDGERSYEAFREASRQRDTFRAALAASTSQYARWQPAWEREEEIEALYKYEDFRDAAERHYNDALVSLYRALETAPRSSAEERAVKGALGTIFSERYGEALEAGSVQVPPAFFEGMVKSLGLLEQASKMAEGGLVSIETEPAGAEVDCYRYEARQARLVPVPFHPEPGRISDEDRIPILQIEKVVPAPFRPFEVGDRLLAVDGREVRHLGDLAGVLSSVGEDQVVEATVLRAGEEIEAPWMPFPGRLYAASEDLVPPFMPGRLLDPYLQLGLLFEAYPLVVAGNCLGTTASGSPITVNLPRGSYLFVLRKEGCVEARYPLVLPGGAGVHRIRLVRKEDLPEGFVYIPTGPFIRGGDPDAYQGFEKEERQVPGFAMKRLEVTFREYLKFLNDPEVLAQIGKDGKVDHQENWNDPVLKSLRSKSDRLNLIPMREKRGKYVPFLKQEEGGKGWKGIDRLELEWPVLGLPMLASVEYAHWLTGRSGGRWLFRLPTEDEWEKSARGADRRIFVWGNHLVWNFCSSFGRDYWNSGDPIDPVGIYPDDESVYGVRDLAGSAYEPLLARALKDFGMFTIRGGNWEATDPRDFRTTTRNRGIPELAIQNVGLRLVAELPSSN
jgi:formylglycine-generating enzyme required for sulfatase activity/tetratricopeptide (TPR) repeat protein